MSNIWLWIRSLFSRALRVFSAFLIEALPIARQFIMAQLVNISSRVVQQLASTDLSNEEKRKEAFKQIWDYAKENSIPARDSLVNVLIELAVLKYKKEF